MTKKFVDAKRRNSIKNVIDLRKITACGESCVGCNKLTAGLCEGCIETDGHCAEWKESKGCPIALCASAQDVQFCGLCDKFPCQKIHSTMTWDKNSIPRLKKLAMQYKDWLNNTLKLIKEADEQYYGSNVADCYKSDFGLLFCAEENPTMHDSNHAVINIIKDLDDTLEQIKSFYLTKGLDPRIYLKDGQYETMKDCLIKHGFVIENIGQFEHFLLTKKNKIIKTDNLIIKIAQNCDEIDDKLLDNINEAYLISEPEARDRCKYSLRRIVKGKDKLYIGYDKSGEPAAIAAVSYTHNGLCYVDSVETGKKFQGKGYCRELISKIVEECGETLFLSSENPTAIKIYKEAGFTQIKLRDNNIYWRAYYKTSN